MHDRDTSTRTTNHLSKLTKLFSRLAEGINFLPVCAKFTSLHEHLKKVTLIEILINTDVLYKVGSSV